MFYRQLMNPEFLAAEDLQGKSVTLTISRLSNEEITGERGKSKKWVVHFAELEERHKKDPSRPAAKLIVNKTHLKSIAKLHGPETDDWTGKKVQLYPTTCQAFGNPNTPCIRIRAPQEKE